MRSTNVNCSNIPLADYFLLIVRISMSNEADETTDVKADEITDVKQSIFGGDDGAAVEDEEDEGDEGDEDEEDEEDEAGKEDSELTDDDAVQ